MIGRGTFITLAGVAIVAAVFAFLSGGDLATAVPSAFIATVAAATACALALSERLKWPDRPPAPTEVDTSVLLRDALRGGAFGRQTTIARLRALEKRFPAALPPISPEEEERVFAMNRRQFLGWVEARLTSLEAAT